MDSPLIDLVMLISRALTVLLIARAIISWVAPLSRHPLVQLVHRLTEPLLAPVRNLLPPAGGLDFSPIIVLIGVQIVESLLIRLIINVG